MGHQEQNKPVSFLLLEEDLRRDIFMNRLKDDVPFIIQSMRF